MRTFVFRVELVEEKDGRWSAGVPTLPGCATWGTTEEEALSNLRDAVEAYLKDMQQAGERLPQASALEVIEEPVVTVTV